MTAWTGARHTGPDVHLHDLTALHGVRHRTVEQTGGEERLSQGPPTGKQNRTNFPCMQVGQQLDGILRCPVQNDVGVGAQPRNISQSPSVQPGLPVGRYRMPTHRHRIHPGHHGPALSDRRQPYLVDPLGCLGEQSTLDVHSGGTQRGRATLSNGVRVGHCVHDPSHSSVQ